MRKLIQISLMVIILLSVQSVKADERDQAVGNFYLSTGNEAGAFLAWYDPHTLIVPYTDIVFYCNVTDSDSDEEDITVTMYYSNDTFESDNRSVNLIFANEPEPDIYLYTITWTGEPDNTLYHFYYQSFDGENYVRKDDNGNYFDITWGLPRHPPQPNPIRLPTEVTKALGDYIEEAIPFLFPLGVLLLIAGNIYVAYSIFLSKNKNILDSVKRKLLTQLSGIKDKVTDLIW